MSIATVPADLATAAERAAGRLADTAPRLVEGFRAALPAAAQLVGRRLRGALHREGLRDDPDGERHGFGRVEHATAPDEPAALLAELDHPGRHALAVEVTDAVVNL